MPHTLWFKRRSSQVLLGLFSLALVLFTFLAAAPFSVNEEKTQAGLDSGPSVPSGRILVSGTIATDACQQVWVADIPDPAAFARTALIEAWATPGSRFSVW